MQKKGLFFDLKMQVITLIIVIIAEMVGVIPINLGPVKFSLLPMLFALILGMALTRIKSFISYDEMVMVSPYIGISVMYLISYMAFTIGPNLSVVLQSGPALVLQELGNLGTIFLSIPFALLLLKMDRTAIGSGFSNSREGSLAVVADLYGLDSPEGRGVMGSYITGTLLGTIFNGILASLLMGITWFTPEALAMASGTGSASMMSAALAPLVDSYPEKAETLTALAASSQVLTSMDGVYMSLFVGLPLTEWLYRKLKGKNAEPSTRKSIKRSKEERTAEASTGMNTAQWGEMIRVLIYSGVFAMIANLISSWKAGDPIYPLESLPIVLWMFGIIIISNLIKQFIDKLGYNFPAIMYISIVGTIVSIPGLWFGADLIGESMAHMGLLPLCTPILAYAGIATGKDIAAFRQQGINIILVTLLALAGTYVGSAVIANIVLKMM